MATVDNLHDPTKAEVYYFDDRTRQQVLAKQAALAAVGSKAEPAPVKKTVKKAAKKG